jgi:hypothetical protein
MPVQIGSKSHSFSEPTGLLSDCHRRIEMFLSSLERVAASTDRPLNSESQQALEAALRYFREAAPKPYRGRRGIVVPAFAADE